MYRRLFILTCLLVLFTLVGCGSPDPTPVAEVTIEPTETAEPTETSIPPTKIATKAPTETATLEPTNTATATATSTEVPTNTPTPEPTETAVPTEIPTDPPTAVPAATKTAVPPPPSISSSSSPPIGPNLVVNSSFENGTDAWNIGILVPVNLQSSSNFSNFVHSGSYSALGYVTQVVGNVQPGINYRAGVWVKLWSSDGENREISDNHSDRKVRICIDTNGDRGANLPTTICSGFYQPFDTWQYIYVDAIPINTWIRISLLSGYGTTENKPVHVETYWDDVEFGLSPISSVATPTPLPPSRPMPPAPVAFDANAMRDNMNNTRSMLEQMGGLLDRLVRGSTETCEEYSNYYRGLVGSPRYDGVPGEWQGVYNEYIYAVEHGSEKNQPIFDLCFEHHGGGITELNYGVARSGVNDSLNRLIPAIEAANAMLGQ